MFPLQLAPKIKLWGLLACLTLWVSPAHASHPVGSESAAQPCAVLERYRGEVQIFDVSRTNLTEPSQGLPIPCGGWISTTKGRAELRHREGYRIALGAHSFVQLPENNPDGKYSGDGLVIFRGQAFAQSTLGAAPLRVLTASSRTTIQRGSAIILFDQISDESQTIALEGKVLFENRFQPARQVQVAAGEASSLNFRQVRVVPSSPRAVALSVLRPRMQELWLGEKLQRFALHKAKERAERKFAAELTPAQREHEEKTLHAEAERSWGAESLEDAGEGVAFSLRSPASVHAPESKAQKKKNDATHELKKHFARRLAGGEEGGERTLFPGGDSSKPRQVKLEVLDPSEALKRKARKSEDLEKRRLIEELSQIRIE